MLSIENSGNFSPPASTQKRCGSVRALVVQVPTRILISVAYLRALQAAVVSRALRALQASGGAVDRHRRPQSALRPSPGHAPGHLAPPAPRSRAVLSCRYLGVVARDHTIRLGERRVQLPSRVHGRSYAGLRVEVRELLDSRLVVLHDGRVLATQPSPGPYFVLTPRRSLSSDREGRRQRHATAMRKALTDLARAENRPAGWHPRRGAGRARGRRYNTRSPGGTLCRYPRTRTKLNASAVAPRAFGPVATCGMAAVEAKKRPKPIPPGG